MVSGIAVTIIGVTGARGIEVRETVLADLLGGVTKTASTVEAASPETSVRGSDFPNGIARRGERRMSGVQWKSGGIFIPRQRRVNW